MNNLWCYGTSKPNFQPMTLLSLQAYVTLANCFVLYVVTGSEIARVRVVLKHGVLQLEE